MIKPFTKLEDFFLGVLVGIYGNWLISFLDRVIFPLERNYVFYIQLGLVIASFLTFVFYLMFAYIRKFSPSIFWIIHSILPLITFIFQNSFIKDQPILLSQNVVFWATGFPIICLIFFVEFISVGTKPEDFFLGVLVGIYGNWLISFLDRVIFPLERNYVFYIQLGLVIASFLTCARGD